MAPYSAALAGANARANVVSDYVQKFTWGHLNRFTATSDDVLTRLNEEDRGETTAPPG